LIKKNIRDYMGEEVILVDSALEITVSLKKYLKSNYPNEFTKKRKKRNIYLTDKSEYFQSVTKKIFNKLDFKIKLVDIK